MSAPPLEEHGHAWVDVGQYAPELAPRPRRRPRDVVAVLTGALVVIGALQAALPRAVALGRQAGAAVDAAADPLRAASYVVGIILGSLGILELMIAPPLALWLGWQILRTLRLMRAGLAGGPDVERRLLALEARDEPPVSRPPLSKRRRDA